MYLLAAVASSRWVTLLPYETERGVFDNEIRVEEPPKIGIVVSTDEAETLMRVFPEAIWHRYESVQAVSLDAMRDDLDVLIIDVAYLMQHTTRERRRSAPSLGEMEIAGMLSRRFPILVLVDPVGDAPWWSEVEGFGVLEKPVTRAGLLDSLVHQEHRIRIGRLWRFFHKVASAYREHLQWRAT
jgi:hypothetical protein